MAKPRTIGNMIAPPRFLAFTGVLIAGVPAGKALLGNWALGAMAGFDVAALVFLLSCISLLGTREARIIHDHAGQNDANRTELLAIVGVVITVLLIAIAAEAVGRSPQPFTKILIIATLVFAWLFSNMIYALHYAHLVYMHPDAGCVGLEFPHTAHPVYWDFVYFSFTCGMAFATSDVQITSTRMRKIVTIHCLAAFAFNIGVLAFTINVLGSG
ncbi:MAG TPA: DUF1345 domain-containing protein [Sphingomicrobium sp.]|jgi:uncharacterized membrane protein